MSNVKTRTRREIERILADIDLEVVLNNGKTAASRQLESELPRPATSANGLVGKDEMAAYLHSIRQLLERELLKRTEEFSPAAWLWYLRNCPAQLLEAGGQSGFLQVAAVAEAATTRSKKQDKVSGWAGDDLPLEVTPRVVRTLIHFLAQCQLLAFIHERIRLNQRGAEWTLKGPWPEQRVSADLQAALEQYDERVKAASHRYLNRSGTLLVPVTTLDLDRVPDLRGLAVLPLGHPKTAQLQLSGLAAAEEVFATHAVDVIDLESLASFNIELGEDPWWRDDAWCTAGLLRVAADVAIRDQGFVRVAQSTGCWPVSRKILGGLVQARLDSIAILIETVLPGSPTFTTARELIEQLEGIGPELWPVENTAVIRGLGDWVLVDLAAAARALNNALEFTVKDTDKRDRHFELAVQRVIAQSNWAPSDALMKLRRTPLRLKGKHITDADALGHKDEVLLIIDSRGTSYTRNFEIGDRNAVVGARTNLERKASDMRKHLTVLEQNRMGDNYDFTGYERIIGAVVTAVPIYTVDPETRTTVLGLPLIVSLEELADWLGAH